MNPRDRILSVLHGQRPDGVPWYGYTGLTPRGWAERELRNRGMAIVQPVPAYEEETPNVQVTRREVWEGGERFIYRTIHTPVGEATEKRRVEEGYGSEWVVEHLIKKPEDYRAVEFMARDARLTPNYDAILDRQRELGGDGIVLGSADRTPIQHMFIRLMGIERLALDMADGLPEFASLREALEQRDEAIYRLAAESPAELIWCPDNLTDWVASPKLFASYYLPLYNRYADMLHRRGKLLVTHMDGRLGSLVKLIGQTGIDVAEAFTPPPMGNVSVPQAKAAWPEKTIWINYPGSVFLQPPEEITAFTVRLLRECMPGGRFVLGVTENVPDSLRDGALLAMADGIAAYEREAFA